MVMAINEKKRLYTISGKAFDIIGATRNYSDIDGDPVNLTIVPAKVDGKPIGRFPKIERTIFSGPATIVFWDDGAKTVAKCSPEDKFSKKKGIKVCVMKRMFENNFTAMSEAIDSALANAEVQR